MGIYIPRLNSRVHSIKVYLGHRQVYMILLLVNYGQTGNDSSLSLFCSKRELNGKEYGKLKKIIHVNSDGCEGIPLVYHADQRVKKLLFRTQLHFIIVFLSQRTKIKIKKGYLYKFYFTDAICCSSYQNSTWPKKLNKINLSCTRNFDIFRKNT